MSAKQEGGVMKRLRLVFAIVLLWQLPHFLAIAWIYRDDYARAVWKATKRGAPGRLSP